MKFKKGSKVEVMNKVAPTSWRVAEIMSGNGLDFNVRYDGYEDVEKVSRRFIRPSPPAISSQRWVSGDIVEVFVENSWKVATVSKVLKGGQFLVRSHEFTREMKIHRTYIRVPQSWVDDQWVPVGKISGSYGVEPNFSLKMGTQRCEEREDRLAEYNDARLQVSRKPKTLKRASPFCSSIIQAKKFKPDEKDGKQRHVSGHSFKKSWRHASLASKGSKQGSGSAAFLLEKAVGQVSISLLQIRPFVAIGTYLYHKKITVAR